MKIIPPKVGFGKGRNISRAQCLKWDETIVKKNGFNLPHWDQDGVIQFITFRLKDSLPASKLEELTELRTEISETDPFELEKIDYWLNQGIGECLLKYEKVQEIIIDALNYYDGKRFDLFDYVIMPNHVHLIVIPYDDPDKIFQDFKRYTARQINKLLNRKGELWQAEIFDRIIRSIKDYNERAEYIRQNPTPSKP